MAVRAAPRIGWVRRFGGSSVEHRMIDSDVQVVAASVRRAVNDQRISVC